MQHTLLPDLLVQVRYLLRNLGVTLHAGLRDLHIIFDAGFVRRQRLLVLQQFFFQARNLLGPFGSSLVHGLQLLFELPEGRFLGLIIRVLAQRAVRHASHGVLSFLEGG